MERLISNRTLHTQKSRTDTLTCEKDHDTFVVRPKGEEKNYPKKETKVYQRIVCT